MGSMSNYLENKLIDHIFRGISYTSPTTIAIALCTSVPNDTGTGSTITEIPNSNAYARVVVTPSVSNWLSTDGSPSEISAGESGTTTNGSTILFPTATGSWGTITHVVVCDSATYGTGNVLFWGALDEGQVVSNGNTVKFDAGTLSIRIDD